MEFQQGDGLKFIHVICSHIFLFKDFKMYFQVYVFTCKIMIELIWGIRKCGFLLERNIRK